MVIFTISACSTSVCVFGAKYYRKFEHKVRQLTSSPSDLLQVQVSLVRHQTRIKLSHWFLYTTPTSTAPLFSITSPTSTTYWSLEKMKKRTARTSMQFSHVWASWISGNGCSPVCSIHVKTDSKFWLCSIRVSRIPSNTYWNYTCRITARKSSISY